MADPNFANVSLLLFANGTNGSTTITDSSPSPKTLTAFNTAQISTTQSKFGGSSLGFIGASPVITTPFHSSLEPTATGDFTWEAWVYPVSNTVGIFSLYKSSFAGGYSLRLVGGSLETQTHIRFYAYKSGGVIVNLDADYDDANQMTVGAWHHIAISRNGTTWRAFQDGVLVATATESSTYATGGPSENLAIGRDLSPSAIYCNGYIDSLRFTSGVGRYTSAFTAPTADWDTTSEAPVSINASLTAPMGAMSGFVTAYSDRIQSNLTAPMQRLAFSAHDSSRDGVFEGVAPMGSLSAWMGGKAALSLPMQGLVATGTIPVIARADLRAPMGMLAAGGSASEVSRAALKAPMQRIAGAFGGRADLRLGGRSLLDGHVTTGAVLRAMLAAPKFSLQATGAQPNRLHATLTAPRPMLGNSLRGALKAPMPVLAILARAVVPVTYEAYALNLKHNAAEVNDEMTRYTNFPFDQIVRYQGEYYGINDTGLYRLGGNTDYAEPTPTPIAWSWKTTLTDFKSAQLKTVNWAYFGGRMGPDAYIDIHFGDAGQESYSYASPRGASAQNYRQGFGRGIKSRYYALGASGDGALALDHIVFNIAMLARKV